MAHTPTNRELRGAWRKRLFWLWVAASALIGIYIAVAGPFAHFFADARPFVALATPALMFFLLATGLGWLVLLVTSRPRRPESPAEENRREPTLESRRSNGGSSGGYKARDPVLRA